MRLPLPEYKRPKLEGDGPTSRNHDHTVVERMLTDPAFCYALLEEHRRELENTVTVSSGCVFKDLNVRCPKPTCKICHKPKKEKKL